MTSRRSWSSADSRAPRKVAAPEASTEVRQAGSSRWFWT